MKKRDYLCLVASDIAKKILAKDSSVIQTDIKISTINQTVSVCVTYFDCTSFNNFSLTLYEFQSINTLRAIRNEINSYLEDDLKTLKRIYDEKN